MCGITGFTGSGNDADIRRMAGTIAHRGPNDETFFHAGDTRFGFRRLSIIDLEGGRQPLWNEEKTVAVIFNGEIYNFQTLRDELLAKGHRFTTKSDTEVIVHLYEEEGERLFVRLDGMFAIALYDIPKKRLLLARDRLGKKPLYYAALHDVFLFASEPKAILAHPSFKKELDIDALNLYLSYEFVPAPRSIYKNMYKLEPGSYLVRENGKTRMESFWHLAFKKEPERTEVECIKTLDELLAEAVRARLVSDVPLGVYLSGGIDSSLVAWYAARESRTPLETFTVSFTEGGYDETRYARMVAEQLKTKHREEHLSSSRALRYLDTAIEIFDEPLADAAVLPSLLLAEWSKRHITVALGGDGGDELFLGYQNIPAHILHRAYRALPQLLKRGVIRPLVNRLPTDDAYFSLPFKAKRFVKGDESATLFEQDLAWRGSFGPDEKERLLMPDVMRGNIAECELARRAAEAGTNDFFQTLTYLYLKQYLADDVLVKVDRASMAFGQEVRAPLLDYRLAEFAVNLPVGMKFRRMKGKYLLRKVMDGRLPTDILRRPKKGFGVPVAEWLRTDLKPLADKFFAPEYLARQGLFNPLYIAELYGRHLARRGDYRKELWTLLVFQLWYNRWIA